MQITEALSIIARTEFKLFDETDHYAFAGVESEEAMIGTYQNTVIVIDGPTVQFMYEDGEFETFTLGA